MFKLEVPSLCVGTLDTLMNLSDELGKTDSMIESIVRKVEKAASDLSDRRGGSGIELSVGGVPPTRYIQQFAWDSAKYPSRRPLKELVSLIATGAASIEEELKQLSQSYSDKIIALQEAKNRKGGNMMTGDLNDILTEDIMRSVTIHDTEYLKTLFIAVPKVSKDAFQNVIYSLGRDLVGYGGPDWTVDPSRLGQPINFGPNVDRLAQRGSPVVPGSVKLLKEDNDSALFIVTILKGQSEAGHYENGEFQNGNRIDFVSSFMKICKDKRFFVKDFTSWDPMASSKNAIALEQLQVEVDGMKSALSRWCKNHYGDAYVAYVHLKVIRIFVESVLRYGLPVDFTAVLYKIHHGKDVDLMNALDKELGTTTTTPGAPIEKDDDDFHDFVMLKFDP